MAKEKEQSTYFYASRDIYNGLIFVLPLLLFYQVVLFFQNFENVNGADFLTPLLLSYGGKEALIGFHFLLLFAFVGVFSSAKEKEAFRIYYFPLILLESLFYSLAMVAVINLILQKLKWEVSVGALLFLLALPYGYFWLEERKQSGSIRIFLVFLEFLMLALMGGLAYLVFLQLQEANWGAADQAMWIDWLLKSIGAGVNEELFFRLLLFGGLFRLFTKSLSWEKYPAFLVAAMVSSALFSLAHHIGPYGEPIELFPLTFRFLAGVIFSILFLIRGFAVAVYAHGIYDIMVFSREVWM